MRTRFQGPKGGADRAVLLAHGAGTDLDATTLKVVASALAAAGIPSLRFNFPYRDAERKAPDRPAVLAAAVGDAADRLGRRTGLPPERLVLGGRSMGGRICSAVVAGPSAGPTGGPIGGDEPRPALGLLLLGYPLHPAGRREKMRDEHFPRLHVPCLFVSGTRDALAGRDELTEAARAISGRVEFHWLESADHGYRPLKASGATLGEVLEETARISTTWVQALG